MSEKPLHVRMAEALGWSNCQSMGATWWGFPRPGLYAGSVPVPRFDEEWSLVGPLVEEYDLQVGPAYAGTHGENAGWFAVTGTRDDRDGEEWEGGETPAIAVCNLILALAAKGKLKATA